MFLNNSSDDGGFHEKVYNTALRLFKEKIIEGKRKVSAKSDQKWLKKLKRANNDWVRMKNFVSKINFIVIFNIL